MKCAILFSPLSTHAFLQISGGESWLRLLSRWIQWVLVVIGTEIEKQEFPFKNCSILSGKADVHWFVGVEIWTKNCVPFCFLSNFTATGIDVVSYIWNSLVQPNWFVWMLTNTRFPIRGMKVSLTRGFSRIHQFAFSVHVWLIWQSLYHHHYQK